MILSIKRILVGTMIGRLLVNTRFAYSRLTVPTEQLPWLLNDELARRIFARLCRPGRTFVDVGAHIGSVVSGVWTPPSVAAADERS